MYGNQYYKVMLLCPFTDYSYWDQPALVQRNFANCSYDTLYPCSKSSLCHFLFPVSFSFFLYYSILHSSRIVLVSFVVLSSPVLFHIMCALLQPWTCILHLLFPCFTSHEFYHFHLPRGTVMVHVWWSTPRWENQFKVIAYLQAPSLWFSST